MHTFPLISILICCFVLTLMSIIFLYDSRNLMTTIPLSRNTQPSFQKLQNEHLSVIDKLTQAKFNYLDRFFLFILPPLTETPFTTIEVQSKLALAHDDDSDLTLMKILFTGSYNEHFTTDIFKDSLLKSFEKADSLFYQVHRNQSHSLLYSKNYHPWRELYWDLLYKKYIMNSTKDLNFINYIIETLYNDDVKGFVVFDVSKVVDIEALQNLFKTLQSKEHENFLMFSKQKSRTYALSSSKLNGHQQQFLIDLTDINPTIQALIGSGINFNNEGFIQKEFLRAFNQTDHSQQAVLFYNNVYQLMSLYLRTLESTYFKNENLAAHLEKLNQDYDFIKEYFITNIFMNIEQIKNGTQGKVEYFQKFHGYCQEFQKQVFLIMNGLYLESKWTVNHYMYLVLQVTVLILIGIAISRSCLFIVEDEEEVNTKLLQYLILAGVGGFLYLLYNTSGWDNSSLIIVVAAMLTGFISCSQLFKGDTVQSKISSIQRANNSFLIVLAMGVALTFLNDSIQIRVLSSIVVGVLLIQMFRLFRAKLLNSTIIILIFLTATILVVDIEAINNYIIRVPLEKFYANFYIRSYLPTLLLIIIHEVILSSASIVYLVNRKFFLNIFRIKNILCLILVPRIWLGDSSIVLKSKLFQFYQIFFAFATLLFVIIFIAEGIAINLYDKYIFMIPFDKNDNQLSYSHYYRLKQYKFETTLLFFLNLLPALLLMNGLENYYTLLGLLMLLSTMILLQAKISKTFNWNMIMVFFIIGMLFKTKSTLDNSYEIQMNDYFVTAISAILKCSSIEIIVFTFYFLYAMTCQDHYQNEKQIQNALDFDRYYENEEEIQNYEISIDLGLTKKLAIYIFLLILTYLVQNFLSQFADDKMEDRIKKNVKMMELCTSQLLMILFLIF